MENKKSLLLIKISLCITVMLSVFVLSFGLFTSTAKAFVQEQPFKQIDYGYDNTYLFFKSGVNPSNNLVNRSYVTTGALSNGYYLYDFGSDNPRVNLIFVCFILDRSTQQQMFLNNNRRVFECGFYSGPVSGLDDDSLDSVYLPYYVELEPDNTTYVGYLNIYDLNINLEGGLYFLVRTTMPYYYTYGLDNGPQFLFWDLNIEDNDYLGRYWYDMGFDAGDRYGTDAGYDLGWMDGYHDGLLEADRDYGINDLLFAIFDTPMTVLYNLFSFTIFGTEVWTIIASLIAILIVAWVIKRFIT